MASGDPTERLWAAWALALSTPGAPEFSAHAVHEPSPGIRAAVCIILAARREVEPLCAMAVDDPTPLVRANACRMLARLAAPNDARLHELLRRRAEGDVSPMVRAAVVDELRLDVPGEVWEIVPRALADASEEVRASAIERLVSRIELVSSRRALLASVTREPLQRLRTAILAALLASAPAETLRTLAVAPAELLVAALEIAASQAIRPEPEVIVTALARSDASVARLLVTLHGAGRLDLSLEQLLDVALEAWRTEEGWWGIGELAVDRALDLLERSPTVSEAAATRMADVGVLLRQWLDAALAEAGTQIADDLEAGWWLEESGIPGAVARVERWKACASRSTAMKDA